MGISVFYEPKLLAYAELAQRFRASEVKVKVESHTLIRALGYEADPVPATSWAHRQQVTKSLIRM